MFYALYSVFLQSGKPEKITCVFKLSQITKKLSSIFIEKNLWISGPIQFNPCCSKVNCMCILCVPKMIRFVKNPRIFLGPVGILKCQFVLLLLGILKRQSNKAELLWMVFYLMCMYRAKYQAMFFILLFENY